MMQAAVRPVIGLLLAALAVGGPGLAAAANTPPLPNHPTYDEIIERGTLEIAVYADFPPFSGRVDGEFVGLDVDLGRLIAADLGVEAVFRELPPGETVSDDLRHAIWKGDLLGSPINDLMMHVPSERAFALREELVVIMGSYYQERLALVRHLEKTGDSGSLAVYRYEKIGVELDSLPDFFLSGFRGGMLRDNVVHYRRVADAVAAMLAGEVAAVFAPRTQIDAALGPLPEGYAIGPVVAPGLVNDRWNLGLAVSTQNRQLGYAIDDIVLARLASGDIEALFDKHGLTWHPPQ